MHLCYTSKPLVCTSVIYSIIYLINILQADNQDEKFLMTSLPLTLSKIKLSRNTKGNKKEESRWELETKHL